MEKFILPPDVNKEDYNFLYENEHLNNHIIYLTTAGSKSYGTNTATSDTDIRGIAIERKEEIYGNNHFEQFENQATDTVIYGLKKFVKLCCNCNPNVIELLGTRLEDIIYIDEIGMYLRNNAHLFLTTKAYMSFAGYATSQLRKLENALAHDSYSNEEKERHILKSIESMMLNAKQEYGVNNGDIKFYLPHDNDEITIDIDVKNIPLRKFLGFKSDMTNMLRNYSKLNHRNNKKDEAHLRKHAMHLIRLYLTGIDILRDGKINTYRQNDLPLLLGIRNGEISFDEVFRMSRDFEQQMKQAYEKSILPKDVNNEKINQLLMDIYSCEFASQDKIHC